MRIYALYILATLLGAVLAGCTHDDAGPEGRDPGGRQAAEAAAFAEGAYHSEPAHGVRVGVEPWVLQGQTVTVSWMLPQGSARAPLVVYFPGLGETAEAGGLWRRAWAVAGYAVLGIQLEVDGPAALETAAARAGNFRRVARDAFAESRQAARVQAARAVLAELARLQASGDLRFAGVDAAHWVGAGFDLGTLTARNLAAAPAMVPPQALILLSPHPGLPGLPTPAALQVPALLVGGPGDEDPFSWVSRQERTGVWNQAGAGSCQLQLQRASHEVLSGVPRNAPTTPADAAPDGPGMAPGALQARESREGGSGGDQQQGGGGPGGRDKSSRAHQGGYGAWREPPADFHVRTALQAISVAFLDRQVRKLPAAEEWMSAQAAQWLARQGTLACR